jgi:hypothetical protein
VNLDAVNIDAVNIDAVNIDAVSPDEPQAPLLRVVRGDPTPEELAALVAVVSARTAQTGPGVARAGRRRSEWGAHYRKLTASPGPGPGAWRASGLPI